MRTLIVSLALGMVALARPLSAQDATATQNVQNVLTAGDSVRITVWRRPDLSGDYVIAPDGSITHPLFRNVKVSGLPFARAEANLRTYLAQFEENPQFVIEPLIRLAVSGEVTKPSVFAARPETTIGEAIARAGGPTQFAATNRVRLIRTTGAGQQQQTVVNLQDTKGSPGTTALRSGDQIIMDRKKSFFKDILLPTIGVIGSVASLGLLIDRVSRRN
jgi:polysaccharide biosynthesis/export protein